MTRQVRWSLLAALVLRLLFLGAAWPAPARLTVEEDSAEYLRLAENLADGHGFSLAAGPPYTPDVRRTPVYPVVLSALFTFSRDPRGAALFGVLLSVTTVLLVSRIAGALFGPRAGAWTALLLALDLTSAAYASQILTEPLFTLLTMGSLATLVAARGPTAVVAGVAGLVAGLAALCRPIAVLLPFALLPAVGRRVHRSRFALACAAVLLFAMPALLMAAWTYRNHRVAGVTTLTSVAATNVYFHRAAYVAALREHRSVEDVRAEWQNELREKSGAWTEAERLTWLNERGRGLVLGHPLDYAVVALRGMVRMLKPDAIVLPAVLGAARESSGAAALRWLAWAQLLVVYAVAVIGLYRGLAASPGATLVPVAVLVYFCVIGGPEMYPRFRVPLMPLICILAGAAAGTEVKS